MKRAVTAFKKAMGPQQYGLLGKPFVCRFCGHDQFTVQVSVAILKLHRLECVECGHIEFFAKRPPVL
jgi:transcription elongation factor Elf1